MAPKKAEASKAPVVENKDDKKEETKPVEEKKEEKKEDVPVPVGGGGSGSLTSPLPDPEAGRSDEDANEFDMLTEAQVFGDSDDESKTEKAGGEAIAQDSRCAINLGFVSVELEQSFICGSMCNED